MNVKWTSLIALAALSATVAAGCGSGGGQSSGSEATGTSASSAEAGSTAPSGVPAEAQAAATGDIPDNQVFLSFDNRPGGYSIRYPEGWARKGAGADVTIQDRANEIHIALAKGAPPTPASAAAELEKLKRSDPSIEVGKPQALRIAGAPVVKVTYTRLSAADPVTGKRLPLTIDRYEYSQGGRVAIVDLGTPKGVDNVDAYRLISESFKWR